MYRRFVNSVGRRLPLLAGALALALGTALPASAQQTGSVRGTVTDAVTGNRLVGVRAEVVGTTNQARSGNDGTFQLQDVPAGQVRIRVLAVGYSALTRTVEVGANQLATLDFTLRRVAIELDELVVTGTVGEVRRREIGNAVSNISAADIEVAPVGSLDEVLKGRAVGAVVMGSFGQVGGASTIQLRGTSSVMMSNTPLIYVDGVRLNSNFAPQSDEVGNSINPSQDINPEDIERVEVVKGAAATTLYGTEASAGVIQIFTKRGTSGAPAWSFSMEQGVKTLGHVGPKVGDDILPTADEAGSAELAQLAQDYAATGLFLNDCREADPEGCPSDGSFLRNGHKQRYNLSVRGGTDQTNYFISGRWTSEEGVIAPQGSDEWGVRGNFGFKPVPSLDIRYNSSYSHRDIKWIPDGDNAEGFLLNAFRRENGYTPADNDALILDMRLNQSVDHFVTGVQTSWVPIPGFRQRLNVGLDWQRSEYSEERPFGYFRVPAGDRENDTYQSRNLTFDYAGTWEARLGANVVSSFSWGGQVYEQQTRRLNAFGEDFGLPGAKKDIDAAALTSAAEGIVDLTSGGFFFQEMVGIWDQLFLTAGIRWDGFSTFGEDFGLAAYPKFSASYLISDNGFWPVWWDELKLRSAVGWSGRAPGTFDATRTWDAIAGDDGNSGVTPSNPGDPGLGPEKTREFEIGAEGTMFGGRASFEYTYYAQKTFDALVGVQQVPSQGFVSQQLRNVGTIRNRGHEAALNVVAIAMPKLDWELGLRYGNNKSNAENLGGEILPIRGSAAVDVREGFPVPALFGPKLKDPTAVGDGAIDRCSVPDNRAEFDSDPDACGYLGPNMPVWSYGISTRLTLNRRVTLDALGEGQGGHYISLGTARQTVRRNVWPECVGVRQRVRAGDVGNLTAEQQALCANAPTFIDWGRKANFFRLRHVTLSYRLPERWLPQFKNITVSVLGKNLFLIAPDFRGLDPEAVEDPNQAGSNSSGAGVGFRYSYYNMPVPRDIVFKIRADF